MAGRMEGTCSVCGSNIGFTESDDGFYYCGCCNSRAEDFFGTGVDEEQVFSLYTASCNRARPANAIPAEPVSQVKLTTSQYLDLPDILEENMEDKMADGVGPVEPSDFGMSQKNISYDQYYTEIRSRYLMGLQVMIQLQCQALVETFDVHPLIIGVVGQLWLRYLASTGILADDWADRAIHDSETQTQGEDENFQPSAKHSSEPVNIHGKRVVYVWYTSLRNTIPISSSLAISFLVCHVTREAITPADMVKWILEGKLPYFAASDEIERQLGPRSAACPIPTSRMFRPVVSISSQKLESMAAKIAREIGLMLQPVNFRGIASRYCRQLDLPIKEILPFACCICEWSMPSELYLSCNEFRIPTRVCVMSILIVAIRILFDINGYGVWESQSHLSKTQNTTRDPESGLSVVKLLQILEAKYKELDDVHEYSHDLESYLQYCKDVVFSGLRPSYEDRGEEKLIEESWRFYQSNKGTGSDNMQKERGDGSTCSTSGNNGASHHDHDASQLRKEEVIRKLKLDMEENKFCYMPPRVRVKRKDYLHYARRRKDVYIYAVHADYYLILRSCAKVAQVDIRTMHTAVLCFERRLQWLEKGMDLSLHDEPNYNDVCDSFRDRSPQNATDDPMDN